MTRLGIQIGASTSPADLPHVVRRAEELGYGELWLAEDYFQLGGIASAAIALASTTTIPVGLGVVAGVVRHPAVTAMEFATLAGAYSGRFMAGLGHGSPPWMRQMGLAPPSPLRSLREVTAAIRMLLDGETITRSGEYFDFESVDLDHPPSGPAPVYYGVQGPASLRMSGELADGTLLGWFSSPGSVVWAKKRIAEGRERSARSGPHQVVALCLLSIETEDPDGASRQMAKWAAGMLAAMAGSPALESSPEGEELGTVVGAVGKEGLGEAIPLSLLRRFVATGSPEDCAATVTDLLKAGADRVVLVPNPAGYRSTPDMLQQMALASTLRPGAE
ncbi:MAG: LLM class flavin-dependent oxidoreductase [Acidimicrobiia bacterium]|nr:LLM class flavin-dependent oxidoreductase [Acidimicrobiia bacterium]